MVLKRKGFPPVRCIRAHKVNRTGQLLTEQFPVTKVTYILPSVFKLTTLQSPRISCSFLINRKFYGEKNPNLAHSVVL